MIHKTIWYYSLKCSNVGSRDRIPSLAAVIPQAHLPLVVWQSSFLPASASFFSCRMAENLAPVSVQPVLNLPSERIHSLIKYSPATAGSQLPGAIKHTCCLGLVAGCIYLKNTDHKLTVFMVVLFCFNANWEWKSETIISMQILSRVKANKLAAGPCF